LLGLLTEGTKLSHTVSNGILRSLDYHMIVAIFIASIAIILAATLWKLPLAVSSATVGASVGAALALHTGVNWAFTFEVFVSWILTPVMALAVAALTYATVLRTGVRIKSIITYHALNKWLTLGSAFYVSYVLGANTLGLINGIMNSLVGNMVLTLIVSGGASVAGVFFLSRGVAETVGNEILDLGTATALAAQLSSALTIHLFTQIQMPVPVSEAVVGGVIGVGLSRRIALINRRLIKKIVLGWLISPLVGAVIAYILLALI